jgi:hypothetical protein
MRAHTPDLRPRTHVPQADRAVLGGAQDIPPALDDSSGSDRPCVSFQGADWVHNARGIGCGRGQGLGGEDAECEVDPAGEEDAGGGEELKGGNAA